MAFYLGGKANNSSADVRKKEMVKRRDRKKTGSKWSMYENRKEKERWWM